MPTTAALLDFEEKWGRDQRRHADKLEACYSDLSIPPARYFQMLGRAVETPEALQHAPMLVRRLRRMREERERVQTERVSRAG